MNPILSIIIVFIIISFSFYRLGRVIECRRWIKVLKKMFESNEFEHVPPRNGYNIQITWLPTPKNTLVDIPNDYIGSHGVVSNTKEDGSFDLNLHGGGVLFIGTKYKWKFV